MSDDERGITEMLRASAEGDAAAGSLLFPLIYDDLRKMAYASMQGERSDHTLQPTALVNEAYLRLIEVNRIEWRDRTHFFAVAAVQMRRVLVDYARSRSSKKRGGSRQALTLDEEIAAPGERIVDFLMLEEALRDLESRSPRQGRVVELRLFGGFKVAEISRYLGVSERTVKQDWRVARAWLKSRLAG